MMERALSSSESHLFRVLEGFKVELGDGSVGFGSERTYLRWPSERTNSILARSGGGGELLGGDEIGIHPVRYCHCRSQKY